jgi:hypothetical protein
MAKRHTPSRSFTQKPKMVHLMVEDSKTPHNPMGWQLVTEGDAEILVEVLNEAR